MFQLEVKLITISIKYKCSRQRHIKYIACYQLIAICADIASASAILINKRRVTNWNEIKASKIGNARAARSLKLLNEHTHIQNANNCTYRLYTECCNNLFL